MYMIICINLLDSYIRTCTCTLHNVHTCTCFVLYTIHFEVIKEYVHIFVILKLPIWLGDLYNVNITTIIITNNCTPVINKITISCGLNVTYIYTHTCTCTHIHVQIHVHVHVHVNTYMYTVQTYMYTHTCTHIHVHTHIHLYTYMYTYTCTHIHVHVHAHRQTDTLSHLPDSPSDQ